MIIAMWRYGIATLCVVLVVGCAVPKPLATPTASTPRVWLTEPFNNQSNNWSSGTTDEGTLGIANGEYVFTSKRGEWFFFGTPNQSFENVRLDVSVRNVGTAQDNTFGFICNYQNADAFHYLGIGADGYYALVRFEQGQNIYLSSEKSEWIKSDQIPLNAAQYKLRADCAFGRLALYVDGALIATANDNTFSKGDAGLFMLTFEQPEAETRFDNFVVTELRK